MAKADTLKRRRLLVEKMRQEGLLPGVAKAGVREVLEAEGNRPLFGQSKPMSPGSLFGDGFNQKEMF